MTLGPGGTTPAVLGRAGDGPVATRARVSWVGDVGPYARIAVAAPWIARRARPGQFLSLEVSGSDALLPRPFSIAGADPGSGVVTVVFAAVGEGTRRLDEQVRRDTLDLRVTGPLGTAYTAVDGPVVVVGGGYGAAPLTWLAATLSGDAHLVVGAAAASKLCLPEQAHDVCASVAVTTVDGSAGRQGMVTDVIPDLLDRTGAGTIYACGPMPMLRALGELAASRRIACQAATEEHMACGGVGVCMTCVLPLRDAPGERGWHQRRVCVEGPVVDERLIAWEATRWA